MEKIIVLEVNEMPKRVLDWWIASNPSSPLSEMVSLGSVSETVLTDELPRDFYPSQSWASVGMGVPWSEHNVFWYGDPKPAEYPFYWQAAANAGRTVGLAGVLHSSPVAEQCPNPNIRFVMPDVFGHDAATRPSTLGPLHETNLRLSHESARVAALKPSMADARGVLGFARQGVRPTTWSAMVELAGQVASGRWNKERLRVGQSLLLSDVFHKQIEDSDPDLAVMFCNHVASAMHRYWAATFPDDWPEHPYGPAWITRHEDELPFAMRALDRIVARSLDLAERSRRIVVITTSMGQHADLTVDASVTSQAVIRDGEAFLRACGVEQSLDIRGAMVPQLTIATSNPDTLVSVEADLKRVLGPSAVQTMIAGDALTITYQLPCNGDRVQLGSRWLDPEAAGVSIEEISDHRSGRHHPRGLLVASRDLGWPGELDALQVAPTLLDLVGVEPLEHHRKPARMARFA